MKSLRPRSRDDALSWRQAIGLLLFLTCSGCAYSNHLYYQNAGVGPRMYRAEYRGRCASVMLIPWQYHQNQWSRMSGEYLGCDPCPNQTDWYPNPSAEVNSQPKPATNSGEPEAAPMPMPMDDPKPTEPEAEPMTSISRERRLLQAVAPKRSQIRATEVENTHSPQPTLAIRRPRFERIEKQAPTVSVPKEFSPPQNAPSAVQLKQPEAKEPVSKEPVSIVLMDILEPNPEATTNHPEKTDSTITKPAPTLGPSRGQERAEINKPDSQEAHSQSPEAESPTPEANTPIAISDFQPSSTSPTVETSPSVVPNILLNKNGPNNRAQFPLAPKTLVTTPAQSAVLPNDSARLKLHDKIHRVTTASPNASAAVPGAAVLNVRPSKTEPATRGQMFVQPNPATSTLTNVSHEAIAPVHIDFGELSESSDEQRRRSASREETSARSPSKSTSGTASTGVMPVHVDLDEE